MNPVFLEVGISDSSLFSSLFFNMGFWLYSSSFFSSKEVLDSYSLFQIACQHLHSAHGQCCIHIYISKGGRIVCKNLWNPFRFFCIYLFLEETGRINALARPTRLGKVIYYLMPCFDMLIYVEGLRNTTLEIKWTRNAFFLFAASKYLL